MSFVNDQNKYLMKPFQFKQFKIKHKQTAHKVGTDAVLLGAWTNLDDQPVDILDIGTGSGVIALMLAQRSTAESIDAIEINPQAYEECVENFEASPYNDRLFCYHGDVKTFAQEIDLKYDLIVSNPPFFIEDVTHHSMAREQARQQVSLSYAELLTAVKALLTENGQLAVILPFDHQEYFIKIARQKALFLNRLTKVRGQKNSAVKRSLMQFSFDKKPLIEDELILEISRHQYTQDYKDLVQDFYLSL